MKYYEHIDDFPSETAPVLTIGSFDGVHRGHQAMIQKVLERAREMGRETALLTFSPHPKMVLAPNQPTRLIHTEKERTEHIRQQGIDHLIVHPFTREFAALPARDYVRKVLVEALNIAHLVVGYDHRFGKDRAGDNALLREEAPRYGFSVEEVPPVTVGETEVSSSAIREALLKGAIEKAKNLLSHPFEFQGSVVKGDGRGRKIGFPTANLHPSDPYKLIPGDGVYAVTVKRRDQWYKGMLNIGTRPTVNETPSGRTVEVHLFGLEEEIYGETLAVRFEGRIRGELRFDGMEELKTQLEKDRKTALALLER